MAKKDDILRSFLSHSILKEKYQITEDDFPKNVREALHSEKPIIKAIALVIENLERPASATDNELRNTILQFLNTSI